jgi:hypothetical protein
MTKPSAIGIFLSSPESRFYRLVLLFFAHFCSWLSSGRLVYQTQPEFCGETDTESKAGSSDSFFHCHEILPERFIRVRREELGKIGTVNESASEINLLRRFGGRVTGGGGGALSLTSFRSAPEIIVPSQIRKMIASRSYQGGDSRLPAPLILSGERVLGSSCPSRAGVATGQNYYKDTLFANGGHASQ